jgi:hypothetical protein
MLPQIMQSTGEHININLHSQQRPAASASPNRTALSDSHIGWKQPRLHYAALTHRDPSTSHQVLVLKN